MEHFEKMEKIYINDDIQEIINKLQNEKKSLLVIKNDIKKNQRKRIKRRNSKNRIFLK